MKKLIALGGILLSANMYAQVIENGTYNIVSKYSGDCVELESLNENAKIIQSICADKETQKFEFNHIENDYYTISSLSVGQNSNTNGAHIYKSTEEDQFKIKMKKKNNNFFRIIEKDGGKYLTVKPHTNEIVQYHGHGGSDQLWKIVSDISDIDIPDINNEITFNGIIYNEIVSPITGRVWLDRNLRASQVCTSSIDAACYGDYFNVNAIDDPSICPIGFRIPTFEEVSADTIADSIQNTNINNDGNIEIINTNTAFMNFLKLPAAGVRYDYGSMNYVGSIGFIWGNYPKGVVQYNSTGTLYDKNYQNNNFSVRCIKN